MRAAYWRLRERWERSRERPSFWASALVGLGLILVAVGAAVGAVRVPPSEFASALLDSEHPLHAVLVDVRLPRVVAAALVGAALSGAGALMQAVVRNPLADPGLIGVTAGAGVAALLAIVWFPETTLGLPLFAFVGASVAVAVVLTTAWTGSGSASAPLRVILSGVAVQAIGFGLLALIQFFYADRAPAFASFVVGSLNGASWNDVAILLAPTLLGLAAALASVRTLDLLLFDDATAGGVGLGVRRARLAVSGLAALLAAGAVSVAGLLAFVGLIVPNAVRVVVGPGHAALLPLAVLGGAALVLAADTLGRTAAAPLELPVGAIMAVVGGPYFLQLLWRKLT